MKTGLLLAGLLVLFATPLPLRADEGIAARYPGDKGIENDPAVVSSESFEENSVEAMCKGWESILDRPGMSFSTGVPAGSAGKHSLVMERHTGDGARLFRRIPNKSGGYGYDQIYARYYVKFDPACEPLHHFGTCIGGNNPAVSWPLVNAGYRSDGAKSFWSGIEPFGASWNWDFYTYWCEMRGSPPHGKTWGNSFILDPTLKIEKGKWICVEQMIKMNDVGDTNGEQALWLDGKPISHLGKGFPKGVWRMDRFQPGPGREGVRWVDGKDDKENYTVPEDKAVFEGFRWRTTKDLNVNFVWLYIYTEMPDGYLMKVSFDDVVVATSYIGPIHPAAAIK